MRAVGDDRWWNGKAASVMENTSAAAAQGRLGKAGSQLGALRRCSAERLQWG